MQETLELLKNYYPYLLLVFFIMIFLPVYVINFISFVLWIKFYVSFVFVLISPTAWSKLNKILFDNRDPSKRKKFYNNLFSLVDKIQKDITDYFPIKLPNNLIIIPLQKYAKNQWIDYNDSFWRGFIDGIKEKEKHDPNLSLKEKIKIFLKITWSTITFSFIWLSPLIALTVSFILGVT